MATRVERSNMTLTDSKGNVIRAAKTEGSEGLVNFKWWLLDEDKMAPAVAATIKFISEHQGSRLEQLVVSTRLYGNSSMYNILGSSFTRSASVNSNPQSQRVSYNLVESCVDTLQAKMSKNEIIPTFVTNGGDWSAQKKAKQLTKFAYGLFHGQRVHKKSVVAFTDSAVWGDGMVYVYEDSDNKRACIERVYPHELFVDQIEALSGNPRQIHRVKIMDRDMAMAMFPELEEYIARVEPANYQQIGGMGTCVDLITVTESWHLRSGANAKDGVRVVCIGEGALCYDYDKDYFPFPHLRYARRQIGYWGQGIAERLQNIQGEINRCMILKQRALWMQGAFKILIPIGSRIVTQHLDNNVGTLIHYAGEVGPQYVTPPATNPELQQWIDALMGYGMSQEGISRMSTTGEAPLGVESGKALRTLVQVSDDRFAFMMQDQEAFALEIARQAINVVKDIYKTHGKYEVIFPDKRFIETIDWADINLSEEEYTLRSYPTSALSDDISGRLSEIQELAQAGMVSPRTARRLLDMPDIEVNDALANAPEDRLHQVFEKMLDDEEVIVFEPGFMDAQMGQQLALQYINYAEYMGAPEDRIQLVRDFLEQINNTQAQAAQAMQPPMPAQANPTATPTSPLLQNTPQGAAA